MYEFHCNYIKPKYENNEPIFYLDTDSLIYHIKADDTYKDTAKYVQTRFVTPDYTQ